VAFPNLSTSTKTVLDLNGGDAAPGDTLRYTITLTETAGRATSGVSVTDHIPANATFASMVSIPAGASGGANALVHVTALDLGAVGAPVYCKPASWSAVGPDVAVRVMCYQKSTGQLLPVDDGFQMSYIVPL